MAKAGRTRTAPAARFGDSIGSGHAETPGKEDDRPMVHDRGSIKKTPFSGNADGRSMAVQKSATARDEPRAGPSTGWALRSHRTRRAAGGLTRGRMSDGERSG